MQSSWAEHGTQPRGGSWCLQPRAELCSLAGVAEQEAGAIPTAAGTGGTGGTICLSVLTFIQQHNGPLGLTTLMGTSCFSAFKNKFTYMQDRLAPLRALPDAAALLPRGTPNLQASVVPLSYF